MSDRQYRFDVTPTVAELRAGNAVALSQIFRGKWAVLRWSTSLLLGFCVLAGGALLFFLALGWLSIDPKNSQWAVGMFLPLAGLPIMAIFWLYGARIFLFLTGEGAVGERTVIISRDCIKSENSRLRVWIDWSSVGSVKLKRRVLALTYSNEYIVIPVRCFSSIEEARAAESDMQTWLREAKQT